jgi:hypothetical protein
MEYNYKELVEQYVGKKGTMINWNWYAEKVENNYRDGEPTEDGCDTIIVFVEEFIDGHAGQFIMTEFIKWFGIDYGVEEFDWETVYTDFEALKTEFATWMDAHKPETLEGHFDINFMEADGSLCLYFIMDKKTLSFRSWRISEGYASWGAMYCEGCENGVDYDELTAEWEGIKDEFNEHCEDNMLSAEMDED